MKNNRFGNRGQGPRRHDRPREQSGHSSGSRLRLDGPVLIGRNSLTEVLRRRPEQIVKVYLSDAVLTGEDEIVGIIKEQRLPFESCHPSDLTSATGSDSHQGVAAVLKPRLHPDLDQLFANALSMPSSVIVLLDSIYDPHNLGAILRACECFGVAGVIISKNRGTGITPVVTKSSVGATEFVPIAIVSNLAQSLQRAIDEGFEGVAADVGPDSESLEKTTFSPHSVLVLGSEGEGIQPLLRKLCSRAFRIPMSGGIDSLNVSQAASVLLYAWKSSIHKTDGQSR